ncbi:unnamed protein product [Victoria cruziana]
MGGEKKENKGAGPGGFFQLFDRNGKSKWKKLFSNKSSAVEAEQAKLDEEKLQTTDFHMMDDEKRSECSYPSSLSVDDEGVGVKAPSVVARLMGLESLPCVDVPETNSTLFHENRLVNGPKKCLEFASQFQNLPYVRQPANLEILPCKIVVPRPQKLQKMSFHDKRPIERFQTEPLPGKPVKSYSDIQHRLLSPIKSSGFVSAKSAAHLMETAAKILEPGLHPSARTRATLVGTSSISLKDRGRTEDIISSCRNSRPLELPKKLTEPTAVKVLNGQPMNKSWNGSDGSSGSRTASEGRSSKNLSSSSSQYSTENNQKPPPFTSTKREKQVSIPPVFPNCDNSKPTLSSNQGKSISLAIQAKVNVQKRESLSCSSLARPNSGRINSLMIHDGQDEPGFGRQRRGQLNLQKNKQKQAISNTANVLRQNNQKQNRLPSKCTGVSQPIRKCMTGGNSSSGQKLADHDNTRDHMVSRRNPCRQTKKADISRAADKGLDKSDMENKKCLPGTGDFPRKKRSIEGSFSSDKNGVVGTIFIDERNRTCRDVTSGTTTGYVSQVEYNKRSLWNGEQAVSSSSKNMDVVSFTFTSPLASTAGSRSSDLALNKQSITKGCSVDSIGEKNMSGTKGSRLSALGPITLAGDTLSALLEKKLRELTSGIQMASSLKATNSGNANTVSILQDFLATLNSGVPISKEHDVECLSTPHNDDLNYRCIDEADRSSSSTPMVNIDQKFQVQEPVSEQNSESQKGSMDLIKMDAVEDNERLSPVSILDAAFSNDSYNSVDSSDGVYGGQLDQSCQPCIMSTPAVAADKDFLDSATSSCTPTMENPRFSEVGLPDIHVNNDEELEYVRDIVVNVRLTFEDMAVGPNSFIVDPLLFDKLEGNSAISASVEDEKHIKSERRLWFDCVCECMDSKYGRYSRGDCRSWTKGVAVVGNTDVVNEIFKEMLGWRSMGELMVDEILYKDMSTGTGRWMDYENEEFETGLEVEEDILDSLIEEVVIYTFGLEA